MIQFCWVCCRAGKTSIILVLIFLLVEFALRKFSLLQQHSNEQHLNQAARWVCSMLLPTICSVSSLGWRCRHYSRLHLINSYGNKTIKSFTSGKAHPNEFPTSEVEANPYGKREHEHRLRTKVVRGSSRKREEDGSSHKNYSTQENGKGPFVTQNYST